MILPFSHSDMAKWIGPIWLLLLDGILQAENDGLSLSSYAFNNVASHPC